MEEKPAGGVARNADTGRGGNVEGDSTSRAEGEFLLGSGITLSEPQRLVASEWMGHIPFAFWLVEALRPRSFVELGTQNGCSYVAFLQAIVALDFSASCHAIDTWKGDAHAGYYSEDVYQELAAYNDIHFGDFSRLLRMTFDEALAGFPDGTIDVIHIDGLHTYEAASHDVRAWLPKLSSRGVLLLHDIAVRERDFGVWRVWDELSAKYPSFSFLHCHGLGVVWVGTEAMPPQIAWLLSRGADGADLAGLELARSYFHRLGSGLIDRFENLEKDRASAALTERHRLLMERQRYWGLAPIVHAPRDFSRRLRAKLFRPRAGVTERSPTYK